MRRFKVEFLNKSIPTALRRPLWFDTRDQLDAFLEMTRGCPTDEPIELRVTEYQAVGAREVKIPAR